MPRGHLIHSSHAQRAMHSVSVPGANRRRTLLLATAAGIVVLFAALAFDRWFVGELVARERARVRSYATPFASSLESAVGRRLARLSGLKTLVETRRRLDLVGEDFSAYAEALAVGVPGVRALQLVEKGQIVASWPASSSPQLLGYDLMADVRPVIGRDVQRAMASGAITITGPVELLQGGAGLIGRQRIARSEPGAPDLVAMVIDLPIILDEAKGIASLPVGIAMRVRDRSDSIIDGTRDIVDPVRVDVRLLDGNWHLEAAPNGGWSAAIAADLRPTRIAAAFIVLLLTWLSYNLIGRQERLFAAVAMRTADLERTNHELQLQIREREDAEQRLRDNDERLRLALNSGRMGTWEYAPDTDTIFWSANAMAIMGAAPNDQEVNGRVFVKSIPVEHQDAVLSAVRSATKSDVSGATPECRAEFRHVTPAGDKWLYASGEMQQGISGRSDRLVGVIVDITERRHLEEQLLQSQKMEAVGTLAGGIAHDFNNLLTAIVGFAQLSQMQAAALKVHDTTPELRAGLEELRTDLDEIVKAGERASLLTGQLLAFSRRQVHRPVRVDANGVVREVERMLQRLIGERITLVTEIAPQQLPVLADPGQVGQVIVNLVVNARDALPSGGSVTVRTERVVIKDAKDASEGPFPGLTPGNWVLMAVEDNGIGMTQEVMARIFEPFFTTKRVGEGTGLGLSTVYGIVTQGGGRVLVQSAPGAGTTVQVLLPMHMAVANTDANGSSSVSTDSHVARVLVVEDEPGLRRLVAEILTRRGYQVQVASDGVEALSALSAATEPPDLILSDVVMPRLGGRALADEIAKRGIHVPVLFMSGYPAGEELPEDDAHTFIGKPFTPDALVRKVRALLERV